MQKLPWWKRIVFLSIPFVGMLLLLEVGFRVMGYQPLIIPGENLSPQAYFWISHPYLGFRNRPHGQFRNELIKGSPLVTTDQYGYRNGTGWQAEAETPIVAFIGDSVTFCAEVPDDHTGPSEVAKRLAPDFNIRVLNAGVRGYSTFQAKRMLEEIVERFSDVILIVYVYCANDYVENLNPLMYFPAKAPTVWWNEDRSKLLEIEVTHPTVPWGEQIESRQTFQPGLRLRMTNFLRTQSVVLHQIGGRIRKMLGPKQSIAGHQVVADNKVRLPNGSIGPVNQFDPEENAQQAQWTYAHGGEEALEELLRQMNILAQQYDAVLLATSFSSEGEAQFARKCQHAGVQFVSMAEAFNHEDRTVYQAEMSAGGYDGHYGLKGTQTFAEALVPELRALLLQDDEGSFE